MRITVNGREHQILGDRKMLDYGQVLAMAGKAKGATVTFCKGLSGASGELVQSGQFWAVDGTVINAVDTTSA